MCVKGIKINVYTTRSDYVDWIKLAQKRALKLIFLNMAMHFQIKRKSWNVLVSCATISFSRTAAPRTA